KLAQRAAGLKVTGPHILRHTFCSHLAMAGVPVTAIRDMAGHKSITVTNRYMHLAPDGDEGALAMRESLRQPEIAPAPTVRSNKAPIARAANQETVRRRRNARPKKAA